MARYAALVALLAVACLVAAAQGLTCGNVASAIAPCLPYARGTVPAVPPACCSGIRGLNSAAKTTTDRQTVCNCLKATVKGVAGLKPGLIAGIPGKCGVSVPYPISATTDCSKVK